MYPGSNEIYEATVGSTLIIPALRQICHHDKKSVIPGSISLHAEKGINPWFSKMRGRTAVELIAVSCFLQFVASKNRKKAQKRAEK